MVEQLMTSSTTPLNGGSPDFNLPPMPIEYSFKPNKRYLYTPDPLLYTIYFSSGNSVGNLTTPSESPKVIVLTSDDTDTYHIIVRGKHGHATDKRG